jgi:hypothetical protein
MQAATSAQASAQATLFTLAETQRTEASWTDFINAMESGEVFEIDNHLYDHWLDVLPPKAMYVRRCFRGGIVRRVDFIFAEGDGPKVGFWREGSRLFLQRLEESTP